MPWMILIAAAGLLAVVSSVPVLQPLALAALLAPVLIGISRLRLPGLVMSFLVAENLVHLLKRIIFLLGPQPQSIYLGIQLLPTLILAITLVSAGRRRLGAARPVSATFLFAFLLLTLLTTATSLTYVPYLKVITAAHRQLLPFVMFFVGISLTLDEFSRVGRILAVLAMISVLYGVVQLVMGPTVIDRAWADETYFYSIQASKVFDYMQGTGTQFRAYSYYADPLTWGFFLVACFVGAAVARTHSRVRRGLWVMTVTLIPAGLFVSLTRTCWVSFIGTLAAYKLLGCRVTRRPWMVFATVVCAFPATIVFAHFLYTEVFLARRLPIVANPVVARYITVGTLEARISAWESLKQAISERPQGYGVMPYIRSRSEAPDWDRPLFSHNFVVELVFNSGVTGALLFLLFYFQWLREAFRALKLTCEEPTRRALKWMISFSVGALISGYFNGLNFATFECLLIMGAAAGHSARVSAACKRRALVSVRETVSLQPCPTARLGG